MAIDLLFACSIEKRRGWRENLTHPVRRGFEPSCGRQTWHPLTPPAADVGHQHVGAQVQLGFVEDEPAARPSPTPGKWTDEIAAPRVLAASECRGAGRGDTNSSPSAISPTLFSGRASMSLYEAFPSPWLGCHDSLSLQRY